jgi:ABC-type histidine transport system ATPase subunit
MVARAVMDGRPKVGADNGRIVEGGPPGDVLRNPKEERIRQFLRAVLDR